MPPMNDSAQRVIGRDRSATRRRSGPLARPLDSEATSWCRIAPTAWVDHGQNHNKPQVHWCTGALNTKLPMDGKHIAHPSGLKWWGLALVVTALDLVVKVLVNASLPHGASIPITGFFNLVHVWNTGAAFSFLADAGGWQRCFFTVLALGVSAVLLRLLLRPQSSIDALAYSLIVGGALGNALDRTLRGHVVDYLDFHWGGLHWPAFNVADIAITCAAALLIVSAFGYRHNGPTARSSPASEGDAK